MARLSTSGIQGVIDQMRKLGETAGEAAEAVIMAGAEEVKWGWQTAIDQHGLIDTGQMRAAVGYAKKPKKIGNALGVEVYPQGTDKRGVRNAEKAFIQHYGSSRVQSTRFVDDAEALAEGPASAAMERAWDEAMKKAGL